MKSLYKREKIRKVTSLLLVVFIVSALVYPSSTLAKGYVYVDDNASGSMDGSSKKPYDSIQKAINKAKEQKKDVYVKSGNYRENIEIWEDMEVVGENQKDVTIEARDKGEETVKMNDDTILRKVTVRGGERGIKVKGGDEATIKDCIIKDNKKDGIKIESAKVSDKDGVDIRGNVIEKNGWNGIYSEKRKIVLKDNEINENGRDGVEVAAGSKGIIEDNRFDENDGDGLKLTIDGSEIWTDDNTFYDNDREGLELTSYGRRGMVEIKDSKFYKNSRYGVARIERKPFSDADWSASVIFKKSNKFWNNKIGNISSAIEIF
jgi:hypothetical protein